MWIGSVSDLNFWSSESHQACLNGQVVTKVSTAKIFQNLNKNLLKWQYFKHELPRINHKWLAQQLYEQLHGNYMLKEKDFE